MKFSFCLLLTAALAAAAPPKIHIPIEKYKFDNGLRVVLSEDNTLPVVAVYVVYDVGSRSEEKGRSGFAHLFEHMMFEGSANVKKGEHFRFIESNGGSLNGSTHTDYTNYFETLPANKLAVALWLESDRMRSLNVTAENLANQKEAVKQERRLSFDNQPYATAIVDVWPTLVYKNWQSSHSLIGSFEDLNAATVEDVSKFFKTHYAPNNAVLVVVGDIQTADAKKLIETYFGDIPSQPQPKHPDMSEPADFKSRSIVHKDPLAQVPGVVVGFPGPQRRTPDYYALNMVDAILTAGDSARLKQELVKGKKSVIQYESNLGWPFAGPLDYRDPGAWAIFMLHNPMFKSQQVVDQLQEEITKLQTTLVDAKELERVKAQVRAGRVRDVQGSLSRARALGQHATFDGDPSVINTELDAMMAVTPAQIQAVAKKYLVANRRAVLEIQPAPQPQQKEGK